MHHREFEPPVELGDSIKCFWYDRMDFGDSSTVFEVMPDGYAEIIFHFGDACSISYNGQLQPLPSPFIMGLLNQPVRLHTTNRFEIIAARCFPWTVFDLLGLTPGKHGVYIFDHPISRLQSKLSDLIPAGKINEAVDLVQKYFLESRPQKAVDHILFKAGDAMREAGGAIPVSHVAAAAHATVRTLQRKFRQSSGYSVKDVSGLMRFEKARNQLWLSPDSNLAALAFDLGYTDQSHLSREFKRYSGTTPAAFARKAKKEERSMRDFVAFIQS